MNTLSPRLLATIAGLGLLTAAAGAVAHANFKLRDAGFGGREYTEGGTAYLSLVAAHGCRDDEGEVYATRRVYALFPNSISLGNVAFTEDDDGQHFGGNAPMAIRAKQDANWKHIQQLHGPVDEFYSHGTKVEDVRAIHWSGGEVPYDRYAELEFRADLPQLSGCTERLRVYVPTVQYCDGGQFNAWIREATELFAEDDISSGYAPYFDVVRDLSSNPLDESCGEGVSVEAYPPASEIDQFLARKKRHHWHR